MFLLRWARVSAGGLDTRGLGVLTADLGLTRQRHLLKLAGLGLKILLH